MRVAISTDGGSVASHFGRCPQYTIVDIENGTIIDRKIVDNPGHEPGFLPEFLSQRGIETIVAGGMGHRAVMMFAERGIEAVLGVVGTVEDVIGSICNGTLEGGESLCRSGHGEGHGEGCLEGHGEEHGSGDSKCGHDEGHSHGREHGCGH